MFLFACAMIACLFTACAPRAAKEEGWKYVSDNGVLIVGLDDTFAPMGFRDENDNLVGFDIDLANAVGDKLGLEIKFTPIDWSAKEFELKAKNIDCIWNGMSATAERQVNMSLTKKYLNNRIVIMALDASVKISSAADLAKYNIGTQVESAALETMQDHDDFALFERKITEYDTYDEAILDMMAKRIDCIVVDEVLGEYKNKNLSEKLTIVDFNFGDDFYAIGCRQGETSLSDKLNETLEALIKDGTAKQISEKWFGRDIVILEGYK